ncbi:hypothetical protein CDV31_006332 [Fusarium ambrosium]|uniref:Transcription factor domain-containing protein n=1 Tax=Fusarium ambrosium TaxID=131363 RepID=A0A428UDY1_9HYPO|nr:hypothetical protein CDV31_006332 [Fusarium ambrosium]
MERVADDRRQRHRRRSKARRREAPGSRDDRILRALEPLSWLRRSDRALLHHFVTEASCIVISSRYGQRLFCNTIVPLALQTPSLLYATLAYSAAQQAGLRGTTASLDTSISRYVGMSLSAFQTEIPRRACSNKTSLLAASLMLCLVSVSSGDVQPRSWRVHVEGAKALLASIHVSGPISSMGVGAELEAIITFLSRWYLSLESLTAITTSGLVTGQCVTQDATLGTISEPGQLALDACDDYFGFPTRLALLFREIGASAWERRQQLSVLPLGATSFLTQTDFDLVADDFHKRLTEIYQEFVCSPVGLNFYPGVREALSESDVHDFTASTEAYLSMARILVERRVRGAPSNSEVVQASVHAIVRVASSITPSPGASPATAMTPPLFAAGCEAVDATDRQAVRGTFLTFLSVVRSQNMEQSLKILESMWQSEEHGVPDWWSYQGQNPYFSLRTRNSLAC